MSVLQSPSSKPPTYVTSRRQVTCAVGGEAVLLHLDDGVYYSLNPVGACIWALLEEPRTADELVERVLEEFEVEAERCHADVEELLAELTARSLVVRRESPT